MRARYGEGTRNAEGKRYYEKHREEILAKRRASRAAGAFVESQRNARLRLQEYTDQVKSVPCMDCGWDGSQCPAAMDLDHVWGEKIAAVAQIIRNGGSLEVLKEEIAKCEVVCARCHRIRTVRRKTSDW